MAVYLANAVFTPSGRLAYLLSAHVDTLARPWMWWQFLTYGFVHDPNSFGHILFNMLGLWFFGRDIEQLYGKREFLRLYLVMLVAGSVVWATINWIRGTASADATLLGASGAIVGTVVLFALNYPHRQVLLFFVLPAPAWVLGVFLVVMDVMGATGSHGATNVAYTVHLTGAAFAFVYFRQKWNLTQLTAGRFSWSFLRRRPKLRVHDPDRKDAELSSEVDRILEKISLQGESSLSRKERRTLEDASRKYQQRRGQG